MNIADENQVLKGKQLEKFKLKQEKTDMKAILETEFGRRFIWKWLSLSGVYQQSAENSGSWTYFNEGRRAIGLKLLDEVVTVSPEAYLLMIKENKKGELSNGESND